jgi:hypothetical protein
MFSDDELAELKTALEYGFAIAYYNNPRAASLIQRQLDKIDAVLYPPDFSNY